MVPVPCSLPRILCGKTWKENKSPAKNKTEMWGLHNRCHTVVTIFNFNLLFSSELFWALDLCTIKGGAWDFLSYFRMAHIILNYDEINKGTNFDFVNSLLMIKVNVKYNLCEI